MLKLIQRYDAKMVRAGLCEPGAILLGEMGAEPEFNREDPAVPVLSEVLHRLNVKSPAVPPAGRALSHHHRVPGRPGRQRPPLGLRDPVFSAGPAGGE